MTTCCAHLNRAQNRRPCSDLQELCVAANFAIGHYPCAGRFVLELRCLVHRHNNSHAIMISDTYYGGLSKIKMCITQPPLHVHNEDSTVENGRKLPRADFLCGWLPRSSIVKAPGCAARWRNSWRRRQTSGPRDNWRRGEYRCLAERFRRDF